MPGRRADADAVNVGRLILDGCEVGGGGNDIHSIQSRYEPDRDRIVVTLRLCGAARPNATYRVHLDHAAPFVGKARRSRPAAPRPPTAWSRAPRRSSRRRHQPDRRRHCPLRRAAGEAACRQAQGRAPDPVVGDEHARQGEGSRAEPRDRRRLRASAGDHRDAGAGAGRGHRPRLRQLLLVHRRHRPQQHRGDQRRRPDLPAAGRRTRGSPTPAASTPGWPTPTASPRTTAIPFFGPIQTADGTVVAQPASRTFANCDQCRQLVSAGADQQGRPRQSGDATTTSPGPARFPTAPPAAARPRTAMPGRRTRPSDNGDGGNTGQTSFGWTSGSQDSCAASHHVYCIQFE